MGPKQTDKPSTTNKSKVKPPTDPDALKSKGRDKFVYFYGSKSPFSQHHPAEFVIDDVKFNCAEQYMMYQKAVVFKDDVMKKKIMETKNPVQQKRYGRRVKNFDVDVWRTRSKAIVEAANEAKFSQNPEMKKQLLATHPKTLVESSPRDRLWGIGLGKDNPKAWDKATWRGRNLLGYALTRVRDKLMEEDEEEEEEEEEEEDTLKSKKTGR